MRIRWLRLPMVATLVALAACTGSGSAPATAPPTSAAPTSTTGTAAPTSLAAETTTSTTVDRRTEIQQIFEDLERRRLDALYRGDVAAFSALFANEAYLERSLEAFDLVEFTGPPDVVVVEINDLLFVSDFCISAALSTDYSQFFGDEVVGQSEVVIEIVEAGWGYSWAGEGWRCDGPHPLSS